VLRAIALGGAKMRSKTAAIGTHKLQNISQRATWS
jgi:hypothetical protein